MYEIFIECDVLIREAEFGTYTVVSIFNLKEAHMYVRIWDMTHVRMYS